MMCLRCSGAKAPEKKGAKGVPAVPAPRATTGAVERGLPGWGAVSRPPPSADRRSPLRVRPVQVPGDLRSAGGARSGDLAPTWRPRATTGAVERGLPPGEGGPPRGGRRRRREGSEGPVARRGTRRELVSPFRNRVDHGSVQQHAAVLLRGPARRADAGPL